ncbi:ARF GTPase activating protein [Cryptosporidium felis]|nr:ARF GTPase activating protein [Cryptosporidium felis]
MAEPLSEALLLKKLRAFQISCIENRKCANCLEIGPNYVCSDFGTFVCLTCSGIHRELNHRVKGILVSKWTPEEIQSICNRGNQKDALVFLGNRNSNSLGPPPPSSNYTKLKEFIKNKYIDRLWVNQTPINTRSCLNALNYPENPKTQRNSGLPKNSKNPYILEQYIPKSQAKNQGDSRDSPSPSSPIYSASPQTQNHRNPLNKRQTQYNKQTTSKNPFSYILNFT